MLQNREVKKVMQSGGRIFRNKPELLLPLLGQLEASLKLKGGTTLSTTYINQYLHTDNRIPVIIFWNGITDKGILQKLGLNSKMLNITSYSDNNDNYFNLKLLDISGSTSKLLYSSRIGYLEKNGRMLNLMETHDLVCTINHNITHSHDPIADLTITKCLFNHIIKNMGPIQLYKLCNSSLKESK